MKKKIFKKLLLDCSFFFIIALFSASLIIWVVQAINFLDIIVEDGRGYQIYAKFTLLSFPKIISKIIPFILLISLIFVISNYEQNNELIIFWNFGINKKDFIKFFLNISILITLVQLLIVSLVVPTTQDLARILVKNSAINFFDSFIQSKKFNDNIDGLTIFSDSKDDEGNLNDIYLKKGSSFSDFQIIYAKRGKVKQVGDNQILELNKGETINSTNNQVSSFKFSKTELILNQFNTNTITHRKTQEVSTLNLLKFFKNLYKKQSIDLSQTLEIENCRSDNINNILKELYKRFIIPFYIPSIILVTMLLILTSKESGFYQRKKFITFVLGLIIIIFSETSLRLIKDELTDNLILLFFPYLLIFLIIIFFKYKLNFSKSPNGNL